MPLPAAERSDLPAQNLIVFDGVCVLCSRFFRFMLKHDRTQRFQFATAQSPVGQQLYRDLGLPTEDFETNLVIVDGVTYQKMDAFAAAMRAISWPWRALAAVAYVPRPLRNWLYHRIARNRYALFGKTDNCLIPDASLRARFVPGGFTT
ncbi:MAG: DCC1-like thiol-disulfide oxidoreductase family protein [Pseudomonadota bacterium]